MHTSTPLTCPVSSFRFVRLCILGLWIAMLPSVRSQNTSDVSPPLPTWIGGKQELLPSITQRDLLAIKKSWQDIQLSDVEINPSARYWEGLEVIVSMGEKAVEALVWIYAQDPPRLNPGSGIRADYLINTVFLKILS